MSREILENETQQFVSTSEKSNKRENETEEILGTHFMETSVIEDGGDAENPSLSHYLSDIDE